MKDIIKNILPNKVFWLIALGTTSLVTWLLSSQETSNKLVSALGLSGDMIWLLLPISTALIGILLILITVLLFVHKQPKLPSGYVRRKVAKGIFAYIPRDNHEVQDSTHKLCISCYEQGKPSTLNQSKEPLRMIGLICPNGCPKLVFSHYESE